MAVDVVVVHYRTPDLLRDFITSYEREAWEGCTLTVIDVEGGTPRMVSADASWVGTEENIGYARACNLGASFGSNNVILLANADTVLYGLKECHDALMAHEDWGILGPRQVDTNNHITAGGIFGTETNIGQRGWQETDHGQYDDIRDDAKSVSGSLYFIKRSVWDELTDCPIMQLVFPGVNGAFLLTPHFYEETGCSYHARHHGYKIVYYGPVQMIHHWHASSPHGGWADRQVDVSKAIMRNFLDTHGIIHE